jgi:hypothetical protein
VFAAFALGTAVYKSGELLAPLIDFIHFKSGKKTARFCISLWKTTILAKTGSGRTLGVCS